MICRANQLIGFYMMATLVAKGLTTNFENSVETVRGAFFQITPNHFSFRYNENIRMACKALVFHRHGFSRNKKKS